MAALLEAYITNLGRYAEDGVEAGATLKFPATTEELQSLLKRIGVDGVRYEEIFITSFDGHVLGLHEHLGEYENLDELNHLAHLLSDLEQDELEKFEAVIDSGEYTGSVKDLINLTQNLDCFDFEPGIKSDEELGRLYVLNFGAVQVPESLIDYIDYEAFGRDARINDSGHYYETDTWTDEEGNTHTDTYKVYYDYYICYVTLENFNLSHVPVYMMGKEQLSRYALYMSTPGNRPDLFPQSGYVPKYTNPAPEHDVPESYLADKTFASILTEAEKYLGFPYVWGGSNPNTSFDCSGFVSYVYNQCGWNFGRLGAQGLYNISTRTNNPKPGDLVFFTGTYDTPGVSHVGIYVGDGWMIDCGDPIHYSNLNTSYWQSHFYAYGKLY